MTIEEFRGSIEPRGEVMRRRLFLRSEAADASPERLAGISAAKEVAFKALGLPPGDWHVLEIRTSSNGRPYIEFNRGHDASHIADIDVSISHSGGYAMASVVAPLLR